MVWIYNVAMHVFTNSNTKQSYKALYAGAVGYKNNASKECVKQLGPLPRGRYKIDSIAVDHDTCPYSLILKPYAGNSMCGSDVFRIHGDDKKHPRQGSHGCIVAGISIRHTIWESGERELEVV